MYILLWFRRRTFGFCNYICLSTPHIFAICYRISKTFLNFCHQHLLKHVFNYNWQSLYQRTRVLPLQECKWYVRIPSFSTYYLYHTRITLHGFWFCIRSLKKSFEFYPTKRLCILFVEKIETQNSRGSAKLYTATQRKANRLITRVPY